MNDHASKFPGCLLHENWQNKFRSTETNFCFVYFPWKLTVPSSKEQKSWSIIWSRHKETENHIDRIEKHLQRATKFTKQKWSNLIAFVIFRGRKIEQENIRFISFFPETAHEVHTFYCFQNRLSISTASATIKTQQRRFLSPLHIKKLHRHRGLVADR